MRSPDHLGRSSEAKNFENKKKVKCDRWTDGPMDGSMDGPTKRVVVDTPDTPTKYACTELKSNLTLYRRHRKKESP